ncbi:MAG: efflux transporter outer membrane subunit [Sphingomonadales bacterium]|nr:efflux transporter outer membrane subunit [Sphingomonadales bacterium]
MAASVGLLASCSQAPAYRPPAIATPAAFKEAGPWVPAAPGRPNSADWWRALGDPRLDDLEARLDRANPALEQAMARHDAATAQVGALRARLLPSLDLGLAVSANRQSDNRPLRGSNQPDLYPADTLSASAGFDFDLWGTLRNSLAAGKARAAAAGDEAAAVRLALESDLAKDYIALRALDWQADVLASAVDEYSRADQLTRNRYNGGIASGVDVGRSGAQLADAKAQLADVRNGRALLEHAIASLVDEPAGSFAIPADSKRLNLPPLPQVLPSTLLERRPDIAAAERLMFAANREIGVARGAFFPSIFLGGNGGFQNTGIAGLVAAPNLFWSVGPSVAASLFDGGRRRAAARVARANWSQAAAAYRQAVLVAFQQVEDGMSRLHHLGEEQEAEEQAVHMASQASTLSTNRYIKGAASFLDVVTAQTAELAARRRLYEIEARRLQAAVALYCAIGGNWQKA